MCVNATNLLFHGSPSWMLCTFAGKCQLTIYSQVSVRMVGGGGGDSGIEMGGLVGERNLYNSYSLNFVFFFK